MIGWSAFLVVAAVSIGSAAVLVSLYALGLRLLAADAHAGAARVGAYACFAVAALGVLFGVWLLVPAFHG